MIPKFFGFCVEECANNEANAVERVFIDVEGATFDSLPQVKRRLHLSHWLGKKKRNLYIWFRRQLRSHCDISVLLLCSLLLRQRISLVKKFTRTYSLNSIARKQFHPPDDLFAVLLGELTSTVEFLFVHAFAVDAYGYLFVFAGLDENRRSALPIESIDIIADGSILNARNFPFRSELKLNFFLFDEVNRIPDYFGVIVL